MIERKEEPGEGRKNSYFYKPALRGSNWEKGLRTPHHKIEFLGRSL
jgi:hypothetical protein